MIGLKNLLIMTAIILCIISSFFAPYNIQTKIYILLFSWQLAYTQLNGFLGIVYQATQKMQYISIINIVNRLLFVSLSIAFLHYGFGLLTLFLVGLFSNFVTILVNYRCSRKFVKFNFFSKPCINGRLVKPGIVFSLAKIIGTMVTRVDLLMISFLGTATDVAIYGIAHRLARQAQRLKEANATAFFPIVVQRFHERTMKTGKLLTYSLLLLAASLAGAAVFSFFARDIVRILFGPQYEQSGDILRVLVFYLAFSFAYMPFSMAMQATHNEKISIYTNTVNPTFAESRA